MLCVAAQTAMLALRVAMAIATGRSEEVVLNCALDDRTYTIIQHSTSYMGKRVASHPHPTGDMIWI